MVNRGFVAASRATGFTLIEVMLALSIFALAALAAVKAASEHLNSIGYLQDKTFARYVAADRLALLSLETRWPPENNRTGVMRNAEQDWYWHQQVEQTAISDFRMVTIRVNDREFTDNDDLSSIFTLSQYVGRQ